MTDNGADIKRTILKVNGKFIPDPSELQWGLQSVSASNAGRTMDGLMHVNLVTRKRKLELKWSGVDFDATSEILKAVNDETFKVTYFDNLNNRNETRTFYVGDRTSMVKSYVEGYRRCDVAFNIIEV
jgi:phenylalanyl-tRNA synthetase beta subunit